MLEFIQAMRSKVVVGVVGGSDLVKQQEQLGANGALPIQRFSTVLNTRCSGQYSGLQLQREWIGCLQGRTMHWAHGQASVSTNSLALTPPCMHQTIADHLGEGNLQDFVNWTLRYLSDIVLPIKR
jgi:hypothetical protein